MTRQSERVPPDPYRKARFREIARGIVAKDRYNRKYGIAVDTAGGIANALERAYRDGVHDARTGLRAGLTQDLFAAGEDAGPVAQALRWRSTATALRYARKLAPSSNGAARVSGRLRT